MNKRILWLIDENKRQSRTSVNQLRMILPNSITVEPIFPPYRQKADYLPVLDDPETVCFVIDQKLKDTGIATYTGIELAQYLRSINHKIPIYILTNYEFTTETKKRQQQKLVPLLALFFRYLPSDRHTGIGRIAFLVELK